MRSKLIFLDWAFSSTKFLIERVPLGPVLEIWPVYGQSVIEQKGSKLEFLGWAIISIKILTEKVSPYFNLKLSKS
jgi:hypothetical protein